MSKVIHIAAGPGGFAENKDEAKRIRVEQILPRLKEGRPVALDFAAVGYVTQSYVHALIGEALKRYDERALKLIEFRNCSPNLRSVIELVVDYTLGGFPEAEAV